MRDITDEIGPGDPIGTFYEVRVGNRTEGLADVGGVGDVAVGGEEDGAKAGGVGSIAEVSVSRRGGAGRS